MESEVFHCPYAQKFECSMTFDSQGEASSHAILDHHQVPCLHRTTYMYFYCPYMKEFGKTGCLMNFSTIGAVEQHMKSDHKDTKESMPCPVNANCSTKFKTYISLKRHVNHVHRNIKNTYTCTWEGCTKKLKTETGIKQHINAVHLGVTLKCPDCDRTFTQKIHVQEHVASVHQKIAYLCPHPACRSTFSRKGLADRHFRDKHQGVYIMCRYGDCSQVLEGKYQLQQHIDSVHSGEGVLCEIEHCRQTFPDRATLKEHFMIHHPDRLLPCPRANELQCTEVFLDKDEAEEHVGHSHAYIGLECQFCHQIFSNNHGRLRHEKMHTHPFGCPRVFCECRFKSEEEAIEHSGKGQCRGSRNLYICPVDNCRLSVVGIVVPKGVLERHWKNHLQHGHITESDELKYNRGDPPSLTRLDLADDIYRHNTRLSQNDQNDQNANHSDDSEDDGGLHSSGEVTTEANLQPTIDGEPGGSEDVDESELAECAEFVESENLRNLDDFHKFISKMAKGKGKARRSKSNWFGTALLPDNVDDLFNETHRQDILAHNVALYHDHPNIKINLFVRGRKCAGPGLGTKWFVTEPCPCDVTLDLDTASLKVTYSHGWITITLCVQCVACHETKKVRRVLQYLQAGSQIQKIDFSFLRNMFRTSAQQQWETKSKRTKEDFERIRQRVQEIENGKKRGASLIVLDDEFTILGNTLMEFAAIEYVSGNTLINTLLKHDEDTWDLSESQFLTVLNYMHMKAVYSAGRGLPLLNVHDVATMIVESGIKPETIVLVWHNGRTDLNLLRDFLATGQRGYENLIPRNSNCIPLLQFFRENLPPIIWENKTRAFPVGLEIMFPVFYPGSNLVGRNHQAEVDCCQTRLAVKAFEWLCQPISQRGQVWKPMDIEAPNTLRITEFFDINDNGLKGEAKSLSGAKDETSVTTTIPDFFGNKKQGPKNIDHEVKSKSSAGAKGKTPEITSFFASTSHSAQSTPSASGSKKRTGAKRRGKRVPAAHRKQRLNNCLVTDNNPLITDYYPVDGHGPKDETNPVATGSKRRHSEDKSEKSTKRVKFSDEK